MLELDRDANLTAPILSYDMDPFDLGTNLMALGWGLNGSETVYLQDELQIATSLQVIPLDKCTQYWNVMKQQICAGLTISDTCKGNSECLMPSMFSFRRFWRTLVAGERALWRSFSRISVSRLDCWSNLVWTKDLR